jgi:hypothetical protein
MHVPNQPIHARVAAIDIPVSQNDDFVFEEGYMDDFAIFCDEDLATTDPPLTSASQLSSDFRTHIINVEEVAEEAPIMVAREVH